MKRLILVALIVLLASCGGGGNQPSNVSLQSRHGGQASKSLAPNAVMCAAAAVIQYPPEGP